MCVCVCDDNTALAMFRRGNCGRSQCVEERVRDYESKIERQQNVQKQYISAFKAEKIKGTMHAQQLIPTYYNFTLLLLFLFFKHFLPQIFLAPHTHRWP